MAVGPVSAMEESAETGVGVWGKAVGPLNNEPIKKLQVKTK